MRSSNRVDRKVSSPYVVCLEAMYSIYPLSQQSFGYLRRGLRQCQLTREALPARKAAQVFSLANLSSRSGIKQEDKHGSSGDKKTDEWNHVWMEGRRDEEA